MAFVNITSDQHIDYATHTHGEELLAARVGTYPAQLKWSDLHPPNVKVLPKGSPPAGPGEINWEDTLGGKFAAALTQLEGLLYAMFGSRPNGSPKRQWYDREHPRCLWGPEAWQRRLISGFSGCTPTNCACWDYVPGDKEYAALGQDPPCCALPFPTAPVRSRSGDPAGQFATGTHDREYFPVGSVSRTVNAAPFDPKGSGWFGATQPGRQDGVGYVNEAGQSVTFSWTKPVGVPTPTTLEFFWSKRPPGGFWSGWVATAMNPVGDVYSVTRAAEPHGTEFRWYIKYFYNDPDEGDPDLTRYDPGGDAPPDPEGAYYLQWFTHYNPYLHGLPEMLTNHGGVNIRHGTDYYEFDGSETVQFQLINLVRWVLSWIGGDCCTQDYEHCAETDSRSDAAHHNPRFRGDGVICCIPMPIRWRWSGSNQHPHYMRGGKTGALDSRPLHSRDENPSGFGNPQAARKTWRGINMLYSDGQHFGNLAYGGGYSWGTAPGTFILDYREGDSQCEVHAKYPSWGLRPGDVVDAIHIQEIIDAVNYLIDYGIWSQAPVCTRKRTPGSFLGIECGYHRFFSTGNLGAGTTTLLTEWLKGCEKCCANAGACPGNSWALGGYENSVCDYNGPLYPCTGDATNYTDHGAINCTTWPTPTWVECTSDCQDAKCNLYAETSGHGKEIPGGSYCCTTEVGYAAWCDGGPVGNTGCGSEYERSCQGLLMPGTASNCARTAHGLSYFACTPAKCNAGWDADHGGVWKKDRFDHEWMHDNIETGLFVKATGPPGNEFSGNCLGDIYGCGDIFPGDSGTGLWFQGVHGVYWEGLVADWFERCDLPDCGDAGAGCPGASNLPPAIPGLGWHDESGGPLCFKFTTPEPLGAFCDAGIDGCCGHDCSCAADYDVCMGRAVWVALDLNLDGSGKPYRKFTGRDGDMPEYQGMPGVPRLRDYDLTKNPATWMHDCPCETWTGAALCVT